MRLLVSRFRVVWLLVAVALLAGACTGTREDESATLLIVGVQQGSEWQLALVSDQQDLTAVTERMRFVEGSRRALQAPAVDIDMTYRELGREVAWVLTRRVADGVVSAYLERFEVANVDAENPAGFAPQGDPIELVGAGGLLPEGATSNSVICPSALQVSRDGEWQLILDVPQECVAGTPDFPVIWLVNVAAGTAVPLEARNPVLGVAPFTDQAQREDEERGYFLVAGPADTQIYGVDFEFGTADRLGNSHLEVDPLDIVAMVGSGGTLIALADGELVGRNLNEPEGAHLGPVPTLNNGRLLVADPLGIRQHLLVLGSSQVQVHAGILEDSPEPESFNLAAAGGTIDPLRAYAYLLVPGGVVVVDLYTVSDPNDELRPHRFDVPELTLPAGPAGNPIGVISWIRASDPPPEP